MDIVHDDPSFIASLLRARYRHRLPSSLNELTGPGHGMVALPLHIAWSGLRILDLDRPRQRMSLYRTVLTEGMRDDLCRFLNKGILLELWPVLRKLISTAIKDVWEEAFPELRP
ncbi:transcriptional regulator [Streptomyces phaeochromogenes]|uniref:transcriptional regulator n=1 Tax=Streptomyces phaeochromogenes TaxID=1923 RepID=UPI0033E5E850